MNAYTLGRRKTSSLASSSSSVSSTAEPLKNPSNWPLKCRTLAHAIAAEWENQGRGYCNQTYVIVAKRWNQTLYNAFDETCVYSTDDCELVSIDAIAAAAAAY